VVVAAAGTAAAVEAGTAAVAAASIIIRPEKGSLLGAFFLDRGINPGLSQTLPGRRPFPG
jgi:hypothetical protein